MHVPLEVVFGRWSPRKNVGKSNPILKRCFRFLTKSKISITDRREIEFSIDPPWSSSARISKIRVQGQLENQVVVYLPLYMGPRIL